MNPMGWFREYLIAKTPGAVWDAREDFAVRVCMRFHHAAYLSRHVVECADAFLRGGCIPGATKTLFYALEKTGEDKYRVAIQKAMDRLEEPADASLSALYETLPFRMAYEMNINRMEKVGQTAKMYRDAHLARWDRVHRLHRTENGFSLREEAWFLMALVDGIALCSDQLYEHWRALVDIYRETLSGVLRRFNEQGLLAADLTEEGEGDPIDTAIVLWALLSGVEQGLIDPERYLPVGHMVFYALRQTTESRAADMMEEVFGVR